jgi:sucrose-phosphate synthase
VDASYGQPEECLVKGRGELGGAYIVRLPCGPPRQYVRKELLWPHVREFADRGIAHANAMLAAMAEAGRRCELYVVHGGLVVCVCVCVCFFGGGGDLCVRC